MVDGEDPLAPVIQLRPGQDQTDDDRPVATGPRPEGFCAHNRTELDGEARRVYCRDCKREVPAFDVLRKLAAETERYISARKEAERRAKVAKGHLDDLLRDERNAKSRRRTWRKHEPEAVRHLRAMLGLLRPLAGNGHPVVEAARVFLDGGEVDVRESEAS